MKANDSDRIFKYSIDIQLNHKLTNSCDHSGIGAFLLVSPSHRLSMAKLV